MGKENETGKGIIGLGVIAGCILMWLGKNGLPLVLTLGKGIFLFFAVMVLLVLLADANA